MKPIRFFRAAVLSCYFFLLAALALMVYGLYGPTWRGGLALAIAVIPLLAAMRGLLAGSLYTYRWATLLIIAYIAYGIVEVIANPATRAGAVTILFASFLLFSSLLGYIRAAVKRAEAIERG